MVQGVPSSITSSSTISSSHGHHSQHHPQHHQYNQQRGSLQPLPRPPPAAPPLVGGGMNLVSPPGSMMNSRDQQRMAHHSLGPPPPRGGYPSIPPPPSPNNSYQHMHPPRGHYQHGGQPPLPPPNMLPPGPPLHSSQGPRDHSSSARVNQPQSRPGHHHMRNSSQGQEKDDQVFLQSGLNGDWQSDKDMDHRRQMIQHIVRLLKQRDRNQSQEWLSKLPQMVKQLEVSLYRSAPSFEAYSDISTLKHRLQLLAMEIARKTQHHKEKDRSPGRMGYNRRQHPMDRNGRHDRRMEEYRGGMDISSSILECLNDSPDNRKPSNPDPRIKIKQQRLIMLYHSSKCDAEEGQCKTSIYCDEMKRLWKHMTRCQDNNCNVPHCFSSRTILAHYKKCQDKGCVACAPVREAVRKGAKKMGQSFDMQPSFSPEPLPTPQYRPPQSFTKPPYEERRYEEQYPPGSKFDYQSKMKHKQQRLLLLRHASKCPYEEGTCPEVPYCAIMKRLWKHIADCNNQKCEVQHCISSRYILSHYRRCRDPVCPACAPVREAIKRSHEKDRRVEKDPTSWNFRVASPLMPDEDAPPSKRIKVDEPDTSSPMILEPTTSITSKEPPKSIPLPIPPPLTPPKEEPIQPDIKPPPEPSKQIKEPIKEEPKEKTEDYSVINCFTAEQIETHIASLNKSLQLPPAKLKAKCLEVLKGLQQHQHGWVFNAPVDPVELALPDYFEIIKRPMDLGTIQRKLESSSYHSIEEFVTNVNLTFDNAMTYNQEGSVVHTMAAELKDKFQHDHKRLIETLNKEDLERRKSDHACTLCGCVKLLFEPPVYFCNGPNCPSKRIRRNSHYYIGGNNQYYWCNSCYNELDDKSQIEFADATFKKGDMKKKKNDEQPEESWVQCDCCERWIHQICGLFNARQNKEHKSEYICPLCTLDKRKNNERVTEQPKPLSAVDLPRTKLSEWLEKAVRRRVEERMDVLIQEQAESDKSSLEDATALVKTGGSIIIRQVTSTDRKLDVRDRMKQRYAHKNYPDEFPFRCKCIVVFQNLDGVDVILFALYLYEHGEDNPAPNKRTVYISYLDSVHFLRPRKMRTFIYHEILISYLDYAREKGFATAHIWACPPLKGDDYIFYCKPEDQKTPKDARLRQWYIDMLTECQKRNIVGRVTNMYDLYFANEALDATAVPYLEGDYFPGEAENCIKEVEEGKKDYTKKKTKKKNNKNKKATSRSNSLGEEEDVSVTTIDTKCYKEGGRDAVMVKLGEIIQPMKESFIVAFLNWSGIATEDFNAVPDSIKEIRTHCNTTTHPSDSNLKVIDDDLEELDCEFLNNRQAFLNLCRGNHYQFDELRRAKHSSMMVLWHLHNRDAPKFVQQCVACGREILTGTRYHCATCPDYDLCTECYTNPKTNRGACKHKLEAILVEGESTKESSSSALTEEQRRERQRNIQLHIQLIEHASKCDSKTCKSTNCAKMKGFLKHGEECKIKATGGCKICKRIWTLLRIHAQHCKNPVCTVPNCLSIRERFRQLAKQQQAMDDRRRLEMNRAYRGGISESR